MLAESIACIRESQGINEAKPITAATLLERDLGITRDNKSERLEELQKRFGIWFAGVDGALREAFCLGIDKYLFHSEGFGLLFMIANFFGFSIEKVKPLSVGQLQRVILERKEKQWLLNPSGLTLQSIGCPHFHVEHYENRVSISCGICSYCGCTG
ncbi:hypothetical protein NP603_19775 [Methylomonas sp. SURF-1]|uniref:Uncharacterized protein n=1 Tax=Methylomonas aurea TaxID=2952224 RepID=A0ABT1UM96_9GAMM|nr:hypothetical protein [Methylomonas sp. SURF-1]MCQ8183361.1 hypothetical protein [Methylomonas sp. SURF-1]